MSNEVFVFLRPFWLWAYLPLLLLVIFWWRRRQPLGNWDALVDKQLQAYVIESGSERRSWAPLLMFAVWALCILLLAGPVWEQQEVPVFEAEESEVVLLDLSRSMLTDDIKPDRLTRARFKLRDLLKRSQGVQIALLAFSERPYVISPLTDDVETIDAFVPSLAPDIMPVQGSRIDLAIDRAVELLQQAKAVNGRLVLITDSEVNDLAIEAASRAQELGHQLSIIGVGTSRGAPLRGADGRFIQAANGAIVVPQLKMDGLQRLAQAGGGVAVKVSSDDSDLDQVLQSNAGLVTRKENAQSSLAGDNESMQQNWWVERSPLLLPLIVLAALFLFRRGIAA